MISKGVAQARRTDGMQLSCWQHDLCDYINQIRGRALDEQWSWVAFSGSLNVNFWLAEDIVESRRLTSNVVLLRACRIVSGRECPTVLSSPESRILNPLCRTSACNPLCQRLMPNRKTMPIMRSALVHLARLNYYYMVRSIVCCELLSLSHMLLSFYILRSQASVA